MNIDTSGKLDKSACIVRYKCGYGKNTIDRANQQPSPKYAELFSAYMDAAQRLNVDRGMTQYALCP